MRNALEARGIRCEVRGEQRATLFGEIPMSDAMVEIWLLDGAQKALAREVFSGSGTLQRRRGSAATAVSLSKVSSPSVGIARSVIPPLIGRKSRSGLDS